MTNELPRNEKLPLFNPHRPDFTCQIEATKVPPIDAEADKWFNEALALEAPEIYEDDRDYKKILQLTRQAAQRRHWKAMLNLASLYLEGRDPEHGHEDAIRIVEEAMKLGIPAAYDRMGTYHMEGIVPGDATTAYAFWQKAADMGSPQAMAFLGEKLKATWDNPRESFWANVPVATKMLECAFGQGNGEAAFYLHYLYKRKGNTREDKARALAILHEGVKLGSVNCAGALVADFDGRADHEDQLAPFVDKARVERYLMLANALRFNPLRRFPNLDKVLPLPPAPLPRWDGKRETLLKAAMAVTPPKAAPKPSAASQRSGREHLDSAYNFRETDDFTNEQNAPFAAYWRPAADHEAEPVRTHLAGILPRLFLPGETFNKLRYPDETGRGAIPNVMWQRLLTVRHNHGAVELQTVASLAREVARPEPHHVCAADDACPVTGTWQPWLALDHPLRHAVNQVWRQTWLTAGQHFPDPQRDWLLPLDPDELVWHLLDSETPDLLQDKEPA
ncbi:tetratricopeptide repeat protein [Massilia sp.]|uniref:tetratricopeptide repeat protein n=1 Tax=Massilia sp. TaxID=1882437 RepID=UPI00391B68C8